MMDLTLTNLWDWTKLTVRAPATAFALIKAANVPLEVSILLIALTGVVSGAISGFLNYILQTPPLVIPLGEGMVVTYEIGGPFTFGIVSVCLGVVLAFAIHKIGRWIGGQGSLSDIMAVMAVLQLVTTFIFLIEAVSRLTIPFFATAISMFGLFVALRGLGHAVKVGHEFNNMGKSAGVILMSFVVAMIVVALTLNFIGLTPQGVVGPAPEGALL